MSGLSVQVLGYATARGEKFDQCWYWPQRSAAGLRYGRVTVELSTSGAFFAFLPRVPRGVLWCCCTAALVLAFLL